MIGLRNRADAPRIRLEASPLPRTAALRLQMPCALEGRARRVIQLD
jgi:hypothetical protein